MRRLLALTGAVALVLTMAGPVSAHLNAEPVHAMDSSGAHSTQWDLNCGQGDKVAAVFAIDTTFFQYEPRLKVKWQVNSPGGYKAIARRTIPAYTGDLITGVYVSTLNDSTFSKVSVHTNQYAQLTAMQQRCIRPTALCPAGTVSWFSGDTTWDTVWFGGQIQLVNPQIQASCDG